MTEYPTRIDHTAKAFDTDLQEIMRKVAEMGGLAERQIADAARALVERDAELAEHVIATDPTIDAMQHEIEEKAILTIARRQPMAVDLREISSGSATTPSISASGWWRSTATSTRKS
jgi:phosphate transport system protein